MKVRVEESRPGELRDRAEDVVRTLEKLSGRSLLKAEPPPDEQIRQTPAQIEYPVLRGAITRGETEVDRIRRVMDVKIAKVLEG